MNTWETIEKLSARTDLKFELINGFIVPKEDSVPLSQETVDYILSPEFDFFQLLTLFDMPKSSLNHKKIMSQMSILVIQQINLSEYAAYFENMEVSVKSLGSFRIPDITFSLLETETFNEAQTLENPVSIIEILSPSTEAKDKNQKKEEYQNIESLQEYVLISQDMYKIEQFLREGKTNWITKIYDSEDDTCLLTVGVKIILKELYKNTDWSKSHSKE